MTALFLKENQIVRFRFLSAHFSFCFVFVETSKFLYWNYRIMPTLYLTRVQIKMCLLWCV